MFSLRDMGYLVPPIKCQKEGGKDQESMQSSTTPSPGYQGESDNFTVRHPRREPGGQPFPSRCLTVGDL